MTDIEETIRRLEEERERRKAQQALEEVRIEAARRFPDHFIEYTMFDEYGEPLLQSEIHRELQAHFSQNELLIGAEIPREHGKSVQIAVARPAREIGRNPNIRVKVVCASDELASARGAAMRRLIESERYRRVFPHIRPGDKWGDSTFTVARNTNLVDPTVACYGVSSSVTGGRADLIIFDDVVDVKSIRSAAERRMIKERVENVWLNLRSPKGRAWWISTPWHQKDYSAECRGNPRWSWMRRPVGPNFEPVWPEKWGVEQLKRRREEIGAVAFARGFRLEPISDEDTIIKPEYIGFWNYETELPDPGTAKRVIGVDPAISKTSIADSSAICEIVSLGNRAFVVSAIRGKWDFPELLNVIRRRCSAFNPHEVVVETVAFQKAITDQLVAADAEPFPWPLLLASSERDDYGRDKFTRASWLANQFQTGRLMLRSNPTTGGVHQSQSDLYDELTFFPAGEHDDTLDALYFAGRRSIMASTVSFGRL